MKKKFVFHCLAIAMLGILLVMPEMSFASPNRINSAISNAISLLCSEVVRGVAMIAFIAIALAALTGRLNWGVVVIVIVVIGVVFMAPYIVNLMYSGGTYTFTSCT